MNSPAAHSNQPHVIRLRGSWRILPPGEGRRETMVHVPCNWQTCWQGARTGRLEARRTFHRPTGLEPHVRVELTVSPWRAGFEAYLNGERLPAEASPERAELRMLLAERLLPRNELLLVFPWEEQSAWPLDAAGAVQLEMLA